MPSTPAIGRYTVAPIWKRPRAGSPLLSQLLLGEPVSILATEGDYCRVRFDEAREEGFVAAAQLAPVDEAVYAVQQERPAFALDLFETLLSDSFGMTVTFGARLPEYDGLQLRLDGQRFHYSGQVVQTEEKLVDPNLLLRLARKWLHSPEMAGGRTPTGIGAPEFVQLLLRLAGIDVPRKLSLMRDRGTAVDFVEQCQSGDLAFFDDGRSAVTHVGLLLPGSLVLHVHGRVRIDAVDHFGIFHLDRRKYTHRLRIVRRLLPEVPPEQSLRLDSRFVDPEVDPRQMVIF